jgi:hypothetical protein
MEKKRLNLLLPSAILKMHAKVCIDLGISQTQAFTQYLRCVQEQNEQRDERIPSVPICFFLGKQEEIK